METRLIDLHNDVITEVSSKRFLNYINRAKSAGVEVILVSVWTTKMQQPMQEIKKYRQLIDTVNAKNKTKLLLHIEDAWFINEHNIEQLLEYKPFSIGLTWNEDNSLAGGAQSDGGLTQLGKTIAERLLANGIVIDLAHLNRQSFSQVAKLTTAQGKKLFCSHTCFDDVNPNPRNLDRNQVQAIVDSGGVIGLTLVAGFLGNKRATIHDVYAHIMYFIENFGEDNIAIGTDFFGTVDLPRRLVKYGDFRRFKRFLVKQDFSNAVIDKIFYQNANKFLSSYIQV